VRAFAAEAQALGVRRNQMQYGSTTEATDFESADVKERLVRMVLWFIPRANPDFEPLFPKVRKWLVGIDESGRAQREVAVDSNDEPLFAAPDQRNHGFWTDSDKNFLSSELQPLSAAEFEQLWLRARLGSPNNALQRTLEDSRR
jgi:hypothetical protein